MTRVMLVDDHAVVRVGFRMLLQAASDIDVVAEADSGETACLRYPEAKPDVVVMDLAMPGMGGVEAVRRILSRDPRGRILVLSAHEDTAYPRRVLKAGALGYLSKRSAPDVLIDAVRAVAGGQRYLDPTIAQKLAVEDLSGSADPVKTLSGREFEVFVQLAKGLTVAQIADNLKLSPNTVGTHLYNVKQKLGAANQAELTLIALHHGLIDG
jgi:two-component system invasion response regulator UvrY